MNDRIHGSDPIFDTGGNSLVTSDPRRLIAPSILSANFSRLAEEIAEVEGAGCDWVHVDGMDGHFFPHLTIGPPVIRQIRKVTKLPFDVHLMIDEPIETVQAYRDAGADWLTVHVEACRDVPETLDRIRKIGANVGLSLRPKTPVTALEPYLNALDLVLVMTVEPGFGGQGFMPDMLDKIGWLRSRFSKLISVDGGINLETARLAARKGSNVFVAGSAIFNQSDRKSFIAELRKSIS